MTPHGAWAEGRATVTQAVAEPSWGLRSEETWIPPTGNAPAEREAWASPHRARTRWAGPAPGRGEVGTRYPLDAHLLCSRPEPLGDHLGGIAVIALCSSRFERAWERECWEGDMSPTLSTPARSWPNPKRPSAALPQIGSEAGSGNVRGRRDTVGTGRRQPWCPSDQRATSVSVAEAAHRAASPRGSCLTPGGRA